MEVIYGSIDKKVLPEGTACALGFFDGVHLGHQSLIKTVTTVSKQNNIKSMVFTFEKHPLTILDSENAPKLITDNTKKTKIFSEYGIDIVNYNCVNHDFLNIEPEAFLEGILMEKYNVKAIITGFNFKFGFKGRGDSNLLVDFGKRTGIYVEIIKPFLIDGMVVSSTVIRNFIKKGDIRMANKFLGRCFSVTGGVSHGKKRGRDLGFPTANVLVDKSLIIPKNGVYITKVYVDGMHKTGVTNVGYNPTFGDRPISMETHIIDFNDDIYGENITVEFYERLRDEIKFNSIEELSSQIGIDRNMAVDYFKQQY